MNIGGDIGVKAIGGLVCSHTAVSCLPGDFCVIDTTDATTSAASVIASVLPNIN